MNPGRRGEHPITARQPRVPDRTSWPGNSSINWDHAGTSQASTQIVELDATGRMAAYVNIGCSTDLIIDVVGFLA